MLSYWNETLKNISRDQRKDKFIFIINKMRFEVPFSYALAISSLISDKYIKDPTFHELEIEVKEKIEDEFSNFLRGKEIREEIFIKLAIILKNLEMLKKWKNSKGLTKETVIEYIRYLHEIEEHDSEEKKTKGESFIGYENIKEEIKYIVKHLEEMKEEIKEMKAEEFIYIIRNEGIKLENENTLWEIIKNRIKEMKKEIKKKGNNREEIEKNRKMRRILLENIQIKNLNEDNFKEYIEEIEPEDISCSSTNNSTEGRNIWKQVQEMILDNNFVRKLSACETMGSATVICTDKTGTLTLNQMNVERIIIGSNDILLSNNSTVDSNIQWNAIQDQLFRLISVNSTAHLLNDGSSIGLQTECALLRLLQNYSYDYKNTRENYPPIHQYLFDQTRKRMSTVYRVQDTIEVSVKGAPEYVLKLCTKYVDSNGAVNTLNDSIREQITKIIDDHCQNQAYRQIAIAFKTSSSDTFDSEADAESDLTLIAIASIRDSLRPSSAAAIKKCQNAGIRVIMVTGDHIGTATAIARQCGIAPDGCTIISGEELRSLDSDKLSESVSDVCVVARSSPLDKTRLVEALQKRGEVVAVTGDGTNDVAALAAADVGLSMGKSGTELAKEASDIVVLDDNFESIVKAVSWGRCIFNNVRRFLQFQLTANIVTLFISFISAAILHDTPFKAVQLLWINLIMDSLGALALATGRPHPSLLNRRPQRRSDSLISSFMVQNIAGQCVFQIIAVAVVLLFPDLFSSSKVEVRSLHHYTLLFNAFVYSQMFNLFNARVVEVGDSEIAGISDNMMFLGIMSLIGGVEIILVQFCGKFFSCVPLSVKEYLSTFVLASFSIPFGMFVRKIPSYQFAKLTRLFSKKNTVLKNQ